MALSLFTKLITITRGIKASGYDYENQMDGVGNGELQYDIVEPLVKNVLKMDRSTYHTVYLLSDGRVFVSGYNGNGQLGLGNTESTGTALELTSVSRNVNDVYCGGYCSFFKMKDKIIKATGHNDYGQLGLGDTTQRNIPTDLTLKYVDKIFSGGYHTFFLMETGDVYACGKNDYGQLGLGTISDKVITPTKVPIPNIEYIRCGESHTFFILKDGTIKCCGYNGYSELGVGDLINHEEILEPFFPDGIIHKNIKDIQCGAHHTIFLTDEGNVYGCGGNLYGQLGLGKDVEDSNGSIVKLNTKNIKVIFTDAYSSIFQESIEVLYGCGKNDLGELGFGDNSNRYSVTRLLYTDIWLDTIDEDIVIVPSLDKQKKIFIVDGYFITNVSGCIVTLDKDLILHKYNATTFEEEETLYGYIDCHHITFLNDREKVYSEDNTEKFCDTEPYFQTCNISFTNIGTVIFSLNNQIFAYPFNLGMAIRIHHFNDDEIITSISSNLEDSRNIYIITDKDSYILEYITYNDYSIRKYSLLSEYKGSYEFTIMENCEIDFTDKSTEFYSLESRLNKISTKNGVLKLNKNPSSEINTMWLSGDSGTDNEEDKFLFCAFRDREILFSKDSPTIFKYNVGERITALYYFNKRLYIGTRSGCLYVINDLEKLTLTNYKLPIYRKFKGEIASLKIKPNNNILRNNLIIDENGRYLVMGFTDGRYRKFPLYKNPTVKFEVKDVNYIDDKLYYHVFVKIYDYEFDPAFYDNFEFMIFNKDNEERFKLSDLDSHLEMNKTLIFNVTENNIYNKLRMNYICGNATLGSLLLNIGTIKLNDMYYYSNKVMVDISNYSYMSCSLILEAVKIDMDGNVENSMIIDTKDLSAEVDHNHIGFIDKNNYFRNGYDFFNLYALTGTDTLQIKSYDLISKYEYKDLIKETNYNGGLLANMDILFNMIYEKKNLDDIPMKRIIHVLNLLSRKKIEHVDLLRNQLMDQDVNTDMYGNVLGMINTGQRHYQSVVNPKEVYVREHYRTNIYIDGMKVPFGDIYTLNDMYNNLFVSYYTDEDIKKITNKYVDTTIYKESLALDEKELVSYLISNYENDVAKLSKDGLDIYLESFDDNIDESYLSVYVQFYHSTYYSRIDTVDYRLWVEEKTDSYIHFKLRLNNQVLWQLGNTIHICVNDLDKRNSLIFRDTAKNVNFRYKNYFTPLIYLNETGTIFTYYTQKSENIEIYVDGFLLTPYVDYKVINLPLHLKVPTIVLFKHPIDFDKRIEITIHKENFIDCIVKRKDNETMIIDNDRTDLGTTFIPLLYNSYDVYLDGIKYPRLRENGFSVQIPKNVDINDYNWSYIKFYLEDNHLVRFLTTMLKYKIKKGETIPRPDNIGNIDINDYNPNKLNISNIYYDDDIDGRVFMILELLDNGFSKNTNPIIDCNDEDAIKFNGVIRMDGNSQFRLPYIEDNLSIDSNNPVIPKEDFLNNI